MTMLKRLRFPTLIHHWGSVTVGVRAAAEVAVVGLRVGATRFYSCGPVLVLPSEC